MKSHRIIRNSIILLTGLYLSISALHAQPRALGARGGATGFEVSYQHAFPKDQFLSGDFGIDFGYNANCVIGVKLTGTYNFIWAHPAWTKKGRWSIYAGPGLSVGAVNDRIVVKTGKERANLYKNGFMIGIAGQVGLEYCFEVPVQIAAEIRPVIGIHVRDGVGFYDNGLLGLAPTLALRYKF